MAAMPAAVYAAIAARNKKLEKRLASAEEALTKTRDVAQALTYYAPFRSLGNILLDVVGEYFNEAELDKREGV